MEVLVIKLFKCYIIATSLLISYVVCRPQYIPNLFGSPTRNLRQSGQHTNFETNFTIPFIDSGKSVRFPSSIPFHFESLRPNIEERMDAFDPDKQIRSPMGSEWAMEPQASQTDVHQSRGTRSNKTNTPPPPSDDIVFPDQIIRIKNNRTKPFNFNPANDIAPSCATSPGTTFCEDIENYPKSYVRNLLEKEPQYGTFFGQDVVPNEIFNRNDDKTRPVELCGSETQLVFPKMAQNKDDQWKYVVNVEKYVQGITVEMCPKNKKDQACNYHELFPLGHRTRCVQKYIYRKMIAVNHDSGQLETDSFRIPSCCTCVVEFTADVSMRSGGSSRDIPALPLAQKPSDELQSSDRSDPRRLKDTSSSSHKM